METLEQDLVFLRTQCCALNPFRNPHWYLNKNCSYLFTQQFLKYLGDNLGVRYRSSTLEVLLGKDVLKICSKFNGEHPCRNVVSITLLCNFIEIALRHGRSPVILLHIFRTPFIRTCRGSRFRIPGSPWHLPTFPFSPD